tara:strand:+ start:7240 stop:7647 length:408 start_codon:yes stop_codon:yes gene_type:complete
MITKIIDCLEMVKVTGKDKWLARCPAHEDGSPSLALRQIDDRVLIHCFAGCSAPDIMASMGLTLDDLFEEKFVPSNGIKRPFPAIDILRAVKSDMVFLKLYAQKLKAGKMTSETDEKHLDFVTKRLTAAVAAGGL